MQQINHLPPDRMTPEQRVSEVSLLLAAALTRLRSGKFTQSADISNKSAVSLGFSANQSVHTDPAYKVNTES